MRGYTTDYVNLITDNLRDRYESGFPILKELIQNADDAKARTLIFGTHPGFPDAFNPLLKGSGLWCFNDGEFKKSDEEALRSFGINSKAGDASVIGKFGLGMKGVFHLCEAIFYVAWDGTEFHREGLTPWKQGDRMPHPEWDNTGAVDWQHLTKFGEEMAAQGTCSWFLLWIPLRSRKHLKTDSGQESGAIISRFPGDDPSRDLAFLNDLNLSRDVAEMLPLLRHLERVEHRGGDNHFELQLNGHSRLMLEPYRERAHGQILTERGRPVLSYSGRRRNEFDSDGFFAKLKAREEWPRTRYRDELGYEREAIDKTIPEAAVIFCSTTRSANVASRLQWAVFLPLGDGSEDFGVCLSERALSVILHGQFFLDSGRKTIHGMEHLSADPKEPGVGPIDENRLRTHWNQRLAQDVSLPLVLPTLEDHVGQQEFDDEECSVLTRAIFDSDWFRKFRRHVCRDGDWLRMLPHGAEPRWRVVGGACRDKLRPFPRPPKSDQERPWRVFPELAACDVLPYDGEAPRLCRSDSKPGEWPEQELERLLSRLDGLFVDAPSMDYLTEFLESCAGRYFSTERIQRGLLIVMRRGLQSAGFEARRRVTTKASRLLDYLPPERRLEIAAELPESILCALWEIDASVLLVPKSLDSEQRGTARPDERALAAWMGVLDCALDSTASEEVRNQILDSAQGLLKTLTAEARGRFLKENRTLRIIEVQDARSRLKRPASFEFLDQAQREGTLFGFAEGLREAALGIAPFLAHAIPDAEVCLVRARIYRDLFPNDCGQGQKRHIPAASDGRACLAAVGRLSAGRLGGIADRRKLLELANDPGSDADARRGLRLLLHGALGHRMDDQAKLWIGRHNQHRAWNLLWDAMYGDAKWSRIREELADTVPRSRWPQANIAEIDAWTLLDNLSKTRQEIEAPEEFSQEEREEILSHINHEDLWLRLRLHTTLDQRLVTAYDDDVYLAPDAACSEDPLAREVILIAPSKNPDVEKQQKRWLPLWNDRARIKIALGTEDPSQYWRSVMDALNNPPAPIKDDISKLFRSKAWLPTTCSPPVKPEDVIDLTGSLGEEAHRLVAKHRSVHGPCFAVPDDIDAEVRDHRAWDRVRDEGFSSGPAGLERLELLLEDLPDYNVGAWQRQPNSDEVELLSRCERLPGWRLLETAAAEPFDLATAWNHLKPALSNEIETERLVAVLNWLSEDDSQWNLRKSIHDTYLHQLASHHRIDRDRLPDLRLASADGQWRGPAELCTGVHGAVDAALLDTRQADILGNLVCREGMRTDHADSSEVRPDIGPKEDWEDPPTKLRHFFKGWDSSLVPRPMIGVLLGLLGSAMRELADEYLQPHSFEWLVKKLPWGGPPGGTLRERKLELIRVDIRVETEEAVEVRNLLGQSIRVALDQDAHTLLAGAVNWQGGTEAMIPLRGVEPSRFEADRLREVLRATAEQLSRELHSQPDADFGTLWQELEKSDQLAVGVARRLILDHLPLYLRQLSVKSARIEKQLATCDKWRRRIAETEADGQPAESERKELNQELERLADCIDRNLDEQQAISQAVKSKLEQYQYELSGIPLELFQNADDAVVQLGQINAYPAEGCEVPAGARRFVVDERADGLGFLHWGRRVNARGPVGFDSERRGYDRDLENMLILSTTDKRDDEGLTGKFGLGFKSVLLACEQPRIVSGRLAVRVVSGILPQPWEDAEEARQRLAKLGEDSRLPGTLIDLPEVQGEIRDRVLERFHQISGILCVFGRAIRSISCITESECVSRRSWQPKEICPGVEAGELHVRGDWGASTMALCIRDDSGSLLIALEPRGFRPLPDTVPAIWVTAPTNESSAVGFAVNGDFDLDVGRGRLAGSTGANQERAREIGKQVGDALGELRERSKQDWDSVRDALSLAVDLDALDFWESVWLGLTKGWRSSGSDLAREVVSSALARLCELPQSVPNGLNGSLRSFCSSGEIRYVLGEMLLRADIEEMLNSWPRFTVLGSGRNCVSAEIGNILRSAKLCAPRNLDLPELVAMMGRSRVKPADAGVLGRLRLLTKDAAEWQSDSLRKLLDELKFRSAADDWVEARQLLALHGLEPGADEPRRHALAPPENRLHADYYIEADDKWPAVVFFLFCRHRMEAPTERLAQWMLDADSSKARLAALEYLSDGEYGDRVADLVRERGWFANALNDPGLMEEFSEEQVNKLRRRLVPDAQLKEAVVTNGSVWQAPDHSHVNLSTALKRLHQWWSASRQRTAEEYRNRLFPQDLDLVCDPETGRFGRSSWLMLLALGSFQSMGRTNDEQHRAFVQLCQERGWWTIFTDHDPREEPERWMDIIEDYAEVQHDDEEWAQWLAQFPKLYRLRRWMDDYVERFLSMNRYREKFHLDTILAPRSDPSLQGGGIDPPPLTRTLKVGSHLVVRELLHHGIVTNPLAVQHAYAPIRRIKDFFHEFGVEVSTSEEIHETLQEHLGERGATFCGDYDIPLRIISSNEPLKRKLLLESKLEDRFIDALRRIEVEGRSVEVKRDYDGDTPKFRLTTAGITYVMEPQREFGADEGVAISCRSDFVIRTARAAAGKSTEQPPVAVFMDGFEHHRDRTDDDAAKRMALKHAGYLVWSLTWHDLDAVLGEGDEAANLLGEDDGCTEQQRNLDARWNTGRIRTHLAEPSLMLLVRYLQNPGRTQWRHAVFTELLRLIQPADLQSEALRNSLARTKRQLPSTIQAALDGLPETTVFGGRGRWCDMPPSFADLILALPLDGLEHPDSTELTVVLHLNDIDSQREDYRQEWNGVLRLFNLLQFLPNAWWSTAKGVDRRPYSQQKH